MSAVRFALEVRVAPGREPDLERGYAALRERLEQGVPGLVAHQLCRAVEGDGRWLITSEWRSAEDSRAWEASDDHRRLTGALRECFAEAHLSRYEIRSEVRP